MKFTYRDCCWLFGGMLIGISLIFLWLYVGIVGALNSIPADSINIEVDFNETELVESSFNWMNKTGNLPERESKISKPCYTMNYSRGSFSGTGGKQDG